MLIAGRIGLAARLTSAVSQLRSTAVTCSALRDDTERRTITAGSLPGIEPMAVATRASLYFGYGQPE